MPATTPYQLLTPLCPTPDEIHVTINPPLVTMPATMPPLTDVMPATTATEKSTSPKKASKSWKVTLPSW